MTPDERRRQAIRELIAARLQLAISDQHLKRMGVMRNANTLRRILSAKDYRISSLIDAAAGANLEMEIVFTRRDVAS